MTVYAYLEPPAARTMFARVLIVQNGKTLRETTLAYGARSTVDADHALTYLGYRRTSSWTRAGNWQRCTVQPT